MDCSNCKTFKNAKWKQENKSRYCDIKKVYVFGYDESCEALIPNEGFHCQRYNTFLTTKECLARRKKPIFKKCNRQCKQYHEIVDLHKKLVMHQRKQETPILLLKRSSQDGKGRPTESD